MLPCKDGVLRADCAACVLGELCTERTGREAHSLNTRQHPWNTWEEGEQWKIEQEKGQKEKEQK